MKYQVIALVFSIFASRLVLATDAADAARNSNTASSEVAPLLAQMGAAANAHDVEHHVGFYAHNGSVVFIFNGQPTIGWEAIREKQREVWKNGTSDVVYTMQGKPAFLEPAPGLEKHQADPDQRAQQARRGGWRAIMVIMVIVGLVGATLLYGDGTITPAISVLSAVEGIKLYAPQMGRYVVPITLLILVGLFLIQRKGTAWIGASIRSGPRLSLWQLAPTRLRDFNQGFDADQSSLVVL